MRHCLKKLPEKSHELLVQHYEQRMSGEQIARATDRKVDAIYKQLSRTRQQLALCIEHYRKHFES
ncbi:MAG: sigma factor-like helix-turn-helix DNA-binding protein [Verrucomicrobiales bacterium]